MAETKTETKAPEKAPEFENIFIPRAGAGEDPICYVSVSAPNGGTRSFTLPMGKATTVPASVAEELRRADRAKRRLERIKSSMINEANIR